MPGIHVVTGALFALAVAAASTSVIARTTDADTILRAELERIAQRRIFFGHQSVGVNLLDGIRQLATMAGTPVRIVEVKMASGVEAAAIGHSFVAENGNPLRKLKSFEQAMGPQPTGLDIALVKFCYVDFTAETNAQALFASYRATMDGLKARNPGTTFVHVTAPLTIVQGGLKAQIKQFFGYAPLYGTLENMRREEFNALLRQTYQGHEPVFDLARIESTSPDGAAETVKWKGSVVPAMAPAYTDDGGHLNAAGRLRAARELVSILAATPDRPAVR